MKDLHMLLGYGENNNADITNVPYVGDIGEGGIEYLSIKDAFGDTIMVRDQLTNNIETHLLTNLIDVSSTETYPESPRILFLVSDKTDKYEIRQELFDIMKTADAMTPVKEALQVNGSKFELTPYITADRVYTEVKLVNTDTARTHAESIKTLLTEFYRSMDLIIQKMWNMYKQYTLTATTLIAEVTEQYKNIILVDLAIIETKCKLDMLKAEVDGITSLNKKFVYEDMDLRGSSTDEVFSLRLLGSSRQIGRYYILQIEGTTSDPKLSSALIELCGNVVIDYINGADFNNGVMIHPDYLNNPTSKIFLKGGKKYRVYRSADTIVPSVTTVKEDSAIISKLKVAPLSFRLTGTLVTEKDKIFLTSPTHGQVAFKVNQSMS